MAMTNPIKTLVSKKKRRFIEDGYNLDLTYISDRVIAMGYPSEYLESMFRNKLEDVRNLLEQKHKDHYKIYNLCSERCYDIQKFHNRVATYPFDDHNPPEFGQMKPFCEDVDKWLDEHEQNVAVVHCKAGKGRTGLMICAYLLHRRSYTTAEDVLGYYGSVRTQDQKGVTIPSQRRYVDYYAAMMSSSLQYTPVKMYLTSIVIDPMPALASLGHNEVYVQFEVRQTSVRPYTSDVYLVKRTDDRINLELQNPLLIVGDVKIDFTQKIKLDILNITGRPRYVTNGKLFHFWVNTFFIDQHWSTHLTHDSTVSCVPRPSLSAPVVPSQRQEERNCRSTHNSGGSGAESSRESPLPPPRRLGPSLSSGDPRASHVTHSQGSAEYHHQEADDSPNGSCVSSLQTIHSHPPARTVSIVDSEVSSHANGRREEEVIVNETKHMSISDDFLSKQAQLNHRPELSCQDTTHKSFIDKRTRHASVPETTHTRAGHHTILARGKRNISAGKLMSVRLNKSQIDKAAKDKSGKFSDTFNVTLFLVRPNDQTLQQEFSRSNLICQPQGKRFTVTSAGAVPVPAPQNGPMAPFGPPYGPTDFEPPKPNGLGVGPPEPSLGVQPLGPDSSEESSEEEPELRQPGARGVRGGSQDRGTVASARCQSSVVHRTLTAPLPTHGMVRNSTEPSGSIQPNNIIATSHSTWI